MQKLGTFLICAAGVLAAPSFALAQQVGKIKVNATCQFPITNGTTTGLWTGPGGVGFQWHACGDAITGGLGGPLVKVPKGECFFLTDVTGVNNNVPNHLVVLNDGDHPGAANVTQYPYNLPQTTIVQDFKTPLVFDDKGLFVFDRSNPSPPQNPNVWVTVSGYIDECHD
jgi:hypothetical protein